MVQLSLSNQWLDSAKMAEQIDMPFTRNTHVGSRNNALVVRALWCHLANMIESLAVRAKRQ